MRLGERADTARPARRGARQVDGRDERDVGRALERLEPGAEPLERAVVGHRVGDDLDAFCSSTGAEPALRTTTTGPPTASRSTDAT